MEIGYKEIIDRETGEVIKATNITTLEEALYQEKLKASYIAKLAKDTRKSKSFTFSKMDKVKTLGKILSNVELGYYLVLQTYVDYNNRLIKSSHNKQPMNKTDIGEVLGIKNRGIVKKLLDKLIHYELLIAENTTINDKDKIVYVVNKAWHFKGKTKSKKVVKIFSIQIRKIYKANLSEKGNKQPGDLGLMYKIIPYLHYETNILCENPFEENLEHIKPLSLTELSLIVGIDLRNLQRKITNLRWDGMTVFAKVSKGNKTHLKVNPLVFYRQSYEPDQLLLVDFLIK